MTSIANITVAAKSVELEDGQGTHVFTVTNTYSQTLTYGVKAEPDDRRQKVWFEIDGPKERQLADRQSDQVSVNIKADPDVAPGKYTFHLLAYSTRNPGEDFTNGPTVAFVVKEHPPVHKKDNPPTKSWLPMAALATGVFAVLLSLFALFSGPQDQGNVRVFTAGSTSAMALQNTNKWAAFPELSTEFVLDKDAHVIAYYQITMRGSNSHLVTRLVVDGEVQTQTRAITGNTAYWSPASLWSNKLEKGKHVISVEYRTPVGGNNHPAGDDWQNRTLTAIVLGG